MLNNHYTFAKSFFCSSKFLSSAKITEFHSLATCIYYAFFQIVSSLYNHKGLINLSSTMLIHYTFSQYNICQYIVKLFDSEQQNLFSNLVCHLYIFIVKWRHIFVIQSALSLMLFCCWSRIIFVVKTAGFVIYRAHTCMYDLECVQGHSVLFFLCFFFFISYTELCLPVYNCVTVIIVLLCHV